MKVEKISGSVSSSENLPIYYDLYIPEQSIDESLPVIIFLHGFKGFKDWGAFPNGCQELSKAGFAILAINFSLNGVSESMTEFDQLDLFARETLSQDLDDVGSIIRALNSGEISNPYSPLDVENVGIIGHSRGGHTAVAAVAEYPQIKSLVTWSAVADYNARWSKEMISDWEEKGVTEIKNGRTGQMMPVKDVVYKDAIENADRLMAVKRVQEIEVPALFVHSKGDDAVPYSEAEKLFEHCKAEQKELKLIPDSGHTFDTSHPFNDQEFPEAFDNVLDATRNWFKLHLK